MKELSIEEKAYDGNYKVYTELINRLEDVKNAIKKQNYGIAMDILFKPYPKFQITTSTEFTESDDERIRKGLIQYFSTFTLDTFAGLEPKKILAWLEKQGKKTIWHNEDEEPQRGSLILLIMQSGIPIVAKIIEPNHTFNHGERWAYIDDLLEEQGEKPQGKSALEAINEEKVDNANKVEPKFKVGDWIVQENIGIYKVVEVCESWYEVIDNHNNHYSVGFDKEYMCHLWTIQDAKDGDILAVTMYPEGTWIGIFKEQNGCTFSSYCFVNAKGIFTRGTHGHGNREGIHPATEEQRNILFTKMKEAGYVWDAKYGMLRKKNQRRLSKIQPEEVELIQEVTEDEHWQDVREKAAIAALGGMLADTNMNAEVDLVAQIAVNYADALVKRLKSNQ